MSSLTRREFLKEAGALAAGTALGGSVQGLPSRANIMQEPKSRKPNIIVVFADQLRSHALGCYRNKQVPTPNFDKLASQGVRLTNAVSTHPLCSPFRAMLITGRYPMSNGVVDNDYPLWDGQPTIATALKAEGYATGYIGKWHLESDREPFVPKDRRQGFDYWAVRNCAHDYFDSFYCGDTPERIPLPGYEPDAQTGLAIRYIQKHKAEPFCLFMSWSPPHEPYVAPESYMKRFPKSKLDFRPNVAESEIVRRQLSTHKAVLDERDAERRSAWRKRLDSDDGIRAIISGYYASTAALDDCMGRLLDAIEKAGIAEHTILLFTSDHGDMLGSHRMANKEEPFEESISIPFILRYPGCVPARITTDALLSPIDMMPTLLGLAGVSCPDMVEGLNLAEAAVGKRSDQQDALLIMKMMPGLNSWISNGTREWRGVRTKTHTYARVCDYGPLLLFDNQDDPYQMKNLINNPAHEKLRDEMEAKLVSLLEEAHDPFDAEAIRAHVTARSKA